MIFKENLVVEPLPDAVEPRERILKLPSCKSLIHNVDAKNSLEENSAIEVSIYVFGYRAVLLFARIMLLFDIMLVIFADVFST